VEVKISPSIVVDRVSKEYEIGRTHHSGMLREAIVNWVKRPWGKWRDRKETIWALRDVSFEVEPGGVVGIVGRNGAGKSTLLKILTRITYPTIGTVDMRGRVGSLLEVGTGFHEELTGRENIYLNGSILGMKKREIDARLDEIIDFAGIDRFLDTPIKRYSSGMRLRLGFAVAAHLQTEILLVDEVLAVGDAEFQKKCLAKIESLHRGGRTVLFVSHNMAAIDHLCPRTLWIDNGQVRQDGETDGVIRAYLAHFSGSQRTGPDLADIQEREGTGELRFTGIEYLGADGQVMPVVRSGDAVTIRLHYHAEANIRDARFGINIGKPGIHWIHVAGLRTLNAGHLIPYLPAGPGHIDATCDFLSLMPGHYLISLWAKGPVPDGDLKRYWDIVECCASFDVEPSDFYGTGRGVDRASGLVLLPCKWISGNDNKLVGNHASASHEDQARRSQAEDLSEAAEPRR
jgi:lipopolysaccharide transport system ATP-binding protein